MADRSVRVRLSAEIGDYTGKMANAAAATDKLADAAQKAGDELARMNDRNAAQDVARDAEKAARAEQQAINKRKEGWNTLASGAGKAGLAVTAVGATMVKSYMDFDAQMSKVGAATNASAADMEKLKTAAMNAGAEFGQFTSTDAAGALEELGKAGLNTSESITALSGTMGLAASDNMEVAQAAELTADALNMFGLKGDQATRVADKLAQGAGAASGSAKELGQGLSQVGAVANQMGVPMDDAVQSLALFAKNGVKGSDAGTSLKTMMMALASPTKQQAQALEDLGVKAFDAQGNFVGMREVTDQLAKGTKDMTDEQKNAALATAFGSDAMRVAGIMAKEGADGYDAMGKSMEGFGSAAEIANKKTDNLKGRFAELGGAWENLGISIGGAADGPLKKGVEGLTSLLELASRHQGATQNIAAVVAALGGMGLAAAGLVKTVQGVQAFTGALKAIGLMKDSSKAISATADAAGALGGHAGGVSRTGKALGGIGPAAGIAAAAIAGIAIAHHFNSQNTAAIDATRTSLEQLSGVAEAANAGLTSQAAAVDTAFTGIGEGVDTTRGALALLNEESRQGFMGNAANFMGNLVGMKSGAQSAAEQFTKLDGSLKGLSAGQAAVQMQEISRQNAQVGLSTEKLVGLFPQYSAKLKEQAAAMGVTNLSAQELEGWMGGKLPAAVQKNAQAMASAGGATGQMAQQILANADAAQKMTAAMAAMPDMKRVQLVVDQAQAATTLPQFVDAIKALPPKVRTELETIAKTEGLDAAKAKLAEMRDKQINLIVNAANAQTTVSGFVASLKGLPKETVAKLKTTAETKGLDAAKRELAAIRDKTVSVKTKGDPAGAKTVKTAVDAVPKSKTAKVTSTGNPNGANNVTKAVTAVPDSKTSTVNTVGRTGGADSARAAVNAVPASKTSTITVVKRTISEFISKVIKRADGGIDFFADGGVSYYANGTEDHRAQIAPAGAWRVWAEPETGGEAYIPLANSKRGQSLEILEQVAAMFGRRVEPYASGGIDTGTRWVSRSSYERYGLAGQAGMAFETGGRVGDGIVSAPRTVPAGTTTTFAPQFQISGPDAREVAGHAMSLYRHEARAMAVQLPGG